MNPEKLNELALFAGAGGDILGVGSSALFGLVDSWKGRAAKKFMDAKGENDEMGRKLIEHGAMCYFNAARELEEALKQIQAASAPQP